MQVVPLMSTDALVRASVVQSTTASCRMQGWLHSMSLVPVEAQPYLKNHDELSVQDELLFKVQ